MHLVGQRGSKSSTWMAAGVSERSASKLISAGQALGASRCTHAGDAAASIEPAHLPLAGEVGLISMQSEGDAAASIEPAHWSRRAATPR